MYLISEIPKEDAIAFIHTHHYSKILPRLTKHYLGVYTDKGLMGVVTLGWGTQPLQTIKKLFRNHDVVSTDYLEIGKMCFSPLINNNGHSGSQIMAELIRWVKKNTDCLFLYTMADGIMGKCGYVYQASNFRYIGKFKTSVYMDRKTREKIHPRSAKTLLSENAEYDGVEKRHWLTHDFCEYKGIDKMQGLMFRYIYPLNKKARKILDSYPQYKGLTNPKSCDLIFERRVTNGKFERIPQPDFNMNVFTHNYQKY